MHIVFDIGGTKMRIAASPDGTKLSEPVIVGTPLQYNSGISVLKKQISDLAAGSKLHAIAGGIAGILDREKTKLVHAPNLPDWAMKPIVEDLMAEFRAPVAVENDAALGGLGEAHHGAGIGRKIVAYITIGTGVGGARIVDGHIDERSFGFEPGHQIIDYKNHTSLGELISGKALEARFGRMPSEIADQAVWNEAAEILACGIANMIFHWSPDVVVIGGFLSQYIPLERLEEHIPRLVKTYPALPALRKGVLGERAVLFGALKLLSSSALL